MKKLIFILVPLVLGACHPIEEMEDSPRGNFEALWSEVDHHYCFFAEKQIDWDAVHEHYSGMIADGMTRTELFGVCSQMLDELRDGHTNLSTGFGTSYYRRWWSDYPQNYSDRLIEQYYFNFHYTQLGGWYYGILPPNVAYLRVPSFTSGLGHGNIDMILNDIRVCSGLIIDVRDNGGGDLTNVETLVGHFITKEQTVGYIIHKTGPGHSDFSEPYAFSYSSAGEGNIIWSKPVVVLTNRGSFSAANFFVAVMKSLPNVTLVGATTGGGSGMPYSTELPCGWTLRMSAVSVLDADGVVTEYGIDPTPGCAVDLDPEAALQGHDTILDFAINLLAGE